MTRIKLRIVLLAVALAALEAHGQDDFYFAGDRRVPLTPSDSSRALRIVTGETAAFREAVGRSEAVTLVPLPTVEERYGVVLLRPADGASREAFEAAAAALERHAAVESRVPVYRADEIEMLLVDEFVVRFEPDVPLETGRALLEDELDARILRTDERRNRFTISFPDVPVERALARVNALNSDPRVRHAQPQLVRVFPRRFGRAGDLAPLPVRLNAGGPTNLASSLPAAPYCPSPAQATPFAGSPNDDIFPLQWPLRNVASGASLGMSGADINAVPGWATTTGSPNVVIAVVDLGVESDHPDLQGKIVPGADVTNDGDNDGDTNPQDDDDYHGTAVAGIAAAMSDNHVGIAGVDWHARIAPVRFATSGCVAGGCSWEVLGSAPALAIEAATDLGARVIVNSWDWTDDGELELAIENAVASGAVVVFAAGQHYLGAACPAPDARVVDYPALLAGSDDVSLSSGVIAVSATNQWDEFKSIGCDANSSQDAEWFWGSNHGPEISLSAPGTSMWSTDNGGGYYCFFGTSMAAPLVGGAAALLFAKYPAATPAQVKHWLQEGAVYLGNSPAEWDERFGHGRLDIAGALSVAAAEMAPIQNRQPEGERPPSAPPQTSQAEDGQRQPSDSPVPAYRRSYRFGLL